MGSCAAPSAKGDDKFITTDYLQQCQEWGVDDDQRRFFVRFGVSKANYGAPFADRWFRRHDGGVLKPAVLERQRKSKGVPRGEA